MPTASQSAAKSFEIVRYGPELFGVLDAVPGRPAFSKLRHKSFLNWYYASSEFCRLYLVLSKTRQCLACQGRELMSFQLGNERQEVACLSSFYAFQAGFGFYAFAAAVRGSDAGMMLGGTEQARAFVARAKWTSATIEAWCLNTPHFKPAGGPAGRMFNRLAICFTHETPLDSLRSLLPGPLRGVRVVEQAAYDPALLDFKSSFDFRFAPDLPHLAWRYSLALPFVRYRLFRAFSGSTYIGYVILQDTPEEVLLAQADGNDPILLAAAAVHCISATATPQKDKRPVTLLVCHPGMREVFRRVGFHHLPRLDMPLALGSAKRPSGISVMPARWLFNYDWGDRGLNRPFPDEVRGSLLALRE